MKLVNTNIQIDMIKEKIRYNKNTNHNNSKLKFKLNSRQNFDKWRKGTQLLCRKHKGEE